MGAKLFQLKPNLTAIGNTDVITGALASSTGSTFTLNTVTGTIGNVKPTTGGPFGEVRTDWLYLTSGTYSGWHWRITAVNTSTKVVTIDGTVPGNLTDNYAIRQAVDARCAWTDPATVTYIAMEGSTWDDDQANELKVTKYTGRGAVVVNMKKFSGTGAITNFILGSMVDGVSTATSYNEAKQVKLFLSYAQLEWPSTTPKYSIMYRYNTLGFEDTSDYDWRPSTSTFTARRVNLLKHSKAEDFANNITMKQLAFDLL